jgi:prevent-host-death family protein
MKKAKVSELKARLSSYLAEVRKGETLIVCERATPIARLVPLEGEPGDLRIHEPVKPISELRGIKRVRLHRRVDLDSVLRETRGGK